MLLVFESVGSRVKVSGKMSTRKDRNNEDICSRPSHKTLKVRCKSKGIRGGAYKIIKSHDTGPTHLPWSHLQSHQHRNLPLSTLVTHAVPSASKPPGPNGMSSRLGVQVGALLLTTTRYLLLQ